VKGITDNKQSAGWRSQGHKIETNVIKHVLNMCDLSCASGVPHSVASFELVGANVAAHAVTCQGLTQPAHALREALAISHAAMSV